MQITHRLVGDVAVLEPIGNIVAGGGEALLKDAMRRLLLHGYTRVLIDFARVEYMDSSGLGELVAAHVATQKAGGVLKLLRLTKRLRVLLTITNLIALFESYDDESTALASFAHPPLLV